MYHYNKIGTDEEYLEDGFTFDEIPLARRHDILHNKWVDEEITPEEKEEMYNIIDVLGL